MTDKQWDDIKKEIADITDNVIFTGYVEQEHMEILYKSCEAVLATSVYEGFGFPVLEGMQSGKVVFASDIPSFREVGGESVTYIDMDDMDKALRDITSILNNKPKRDALRNLSKTRAGNFTWFGSANETVNVFKKAFNKS